MFVPVASPKEMARWDVEAVKLGIPEAVLMENAARAALDVLVEEVGNLRGAKILLVMGNGNNGGDAACLARHLSDLGAYPLLVRANDGKLAGESARLNEDLARKLGVPVENFGQGSKPGEIFGSSLSNVLPDIIVDGLLGTGFHGELRAKESDIIAQINSLADRSKCRVLALDVPSGLDACSGKASPNTVKASITVCFQTAKPGVLLPEAAPYVGKLAVRPIGIPRMIMAQSPASARLWLCPWHCESGKQEVWEAAKPHYMNYTASYAMQTTPQLPQLPQCGQHFPLCAKGPAHKGEAGRVLIIGGAYGMSGAPRLAAWGALRGGAGLVTVAAPAAEIGAIQTDLPEALTIPLPRQRDREGDGEWSGEHARLLTPTLATCNAVIVGPGMGRHNHAEDFLQALLQLPKRPPFVLDADALFALAARPALLDLLQAHDVLTPHPGEAALLLGISTAQIQADRFAAIASLRAKTLGTWVLKGAGTLIASDTLTICPWHVPTLAVAGSGDVLAGLIGALVAQSMVEAASLGVYWHALAGLLLLHDFPGRGNSPRDIADALPRARLYL